MQVCHIACCWLIIFPFTLYATVQLRLLRVYRDTLCLHYNVYEAVIQNQIESDMHIRKHVSTMYATLHPGGVSLTDVHTAFIVLKHNLLACVHFSNVGQSIIWWCSFWFYNYLQMFPTTRFFAYISYMKLHEKKYTETYKMYVSLVPLNVT